MTPSRINRLPAPLLNGSSPRVLQVTESLNAEYGGLATACAQLANHLARAGALVTVATVDGGRPGSRTELDAAVKALRCEASWPSRAGYSRQMNIAFETAVPELVHVHGLWRVYLAQAAKRAHRRGVPAIVSTHGMLHAPARRQRGMLKSIVRWLGQDDLLERVHCLHATADEEADEIRKLGLKIPIAVIPWGVEHPPRGPDARRDRQVMMFLGRLHRTKGLDVLIRSWARIHERFPSARLVLAGYDDGGYRRRLASLAASLRVSQSITFEDAVDDAGRERLFAAASVLVLPSPSENFGLVVPEALVRGLPVIATQGTPWSRVETEGCGWWVPPNEAALAGALDEALSCPSAMLREMGERGRQFACATFVWDRVTAEMLALYAWALGRGSEPSFVRH